MVSFKRFNVNIRIDSVGADRFFIVVFAFIRKLQCEFGVCVFACNVISQEKIQFPIFYIHFPIKELSYQRLLREIYLLGGFVHMESELSLLVVNGLGYYCSGNDLKVIRLLACFIRDNYSFCNCVKEKCVIDQLDNLNFMIISERSKS